MSMNIKIVGLVAVLSVCVSLSSHAVELKATNQSVLTNLCMSALSGKRAAMYNGIKASGYLSNVVANMCNVMVLIYLLMCGNTGGIPMRY